MSGEKEKARWAELMDKEVLACCPKCHACQETDGIFYFKGSIRAEQTVHVKIVDGDVFVEPDGDAFYYTDDFEQDDPGKVTCPVCDHTFEPSDFKLFLEGDDRE